MRHNKKFNHLSRTSAHRKAMLANMACSLILHKRIETTVAKAKALRMYVEPLITKCKEDSTHSRRITFAYLRQKQVITELFNEISQKVANRPGGYTRILKLSGTRIGDGADRCIIELVDYNASYTEVKAEKKTPTRRRRSSAKKEDTAKTTATPEITSKTEELAPETTQAIVEETPTVAEASPAVEDEAPKAEEPQAE